MKSFLLSIIFVIISYSVYSQNQYATTSDGRKVVLKNDGTWYYVQSTNTKEQNLTSSSKKTRNLINTSRNQTNTSNRRNYIRGPRGGCYYINKNGNKTYVDRSMCN